MPHRLFTLVCRTSRSLVALWPAGLLAFLAMASGCTDEPVEQVIVEGVAAITPAVAPRPSEVPSPVEPEVTAPEEGWCRA